MRFSFDLILFAFQNAFALACLGSLNFHVQSVSALPIQLQPFTVAALRHPEFSRSSHSFERQAFDGEQEVITVTESIGDDGLVVVETCQIRLVPFVSDDGEDLVRAERTCTTTVQPAEDEEVASTSVTLEATGVSTSSIASTLTSSTSRPTGSSAIATASPGEPPDSRLSAFPSSTNSLTSTTLPPSLTATPTSSSTQLDVSSSTSSATASSSLTSTSSDELSTSSSTSEAPSSSPTGTTIAEETPLTSTSSLAIETAVSVIGVITTTPVVAPTTSIVPTVNAGADPSILSTSSLSSTPSTVSSDTRTASMTAMQAGTTDTNGVQLPGTQLEVKPVGLGIFAGLAVIVLVVVSIVTTERMRHRKNFRDRQAAQTQRFARIRSEWGSGS